MERIVSVENLQKFEVPKMTVERMSEAEKRQVMEKYMNGGKYSQKHGVGQCGVKIGIEGANISISVKTVSQGQGLFGVDWRGENLPVVIGTSIKSLDGKSGGKALQTMLYLVNALSESMPNGLVHEVWPLVDTIKKRFFGSFYLKEKGEFYFHFYQKPEYPVGDLPPEFAEIRDDLLETIRLAKEYFGDRWMVIT